MVDMLINPTNPNLTKNNENFTIVFNSMSTHLHIG